MDFFTHALLPYLLGSSLSLEKRWLGPLVLGGIAPDLDVFLSWAGSILPPELLPVHRGITHSFFFGFLFGLLVLYLAALPRVRGRWSRFIDLDLELSFRSLGLVWGGVVLHLLVDYATTRGAPLFYPWQSMRYSADLFYQIEPMVLGATILILSALLAKRSLLRHNRHLFMVFLVFLLLVGGIRMEGRWAAEDCAGRDGSVYPGPGLFSWMALEERGEGYLISEYNWIEGIITARSAFPRLRVASGLKEAEEALDAAEGQPQVKLFRWRAYAVAVNASFSGNGSWDIEYYDPLVRAQMGGPWSYLRPPSSRYGSVKVAVENGVARVEE
jgi:inner membrane protein